METPTDRSSRPRLPSRPGLASGSRLPGRPGALGVAGTLLTGVALLSGCASVRATAERDRQLAAQVAPWVYPEACGQIWIDVLREIASQGFPLVGPDRALVGQPAESALGAFVSQGYATREAPDGGIEVSSEWNRSWVRLRARGTTVGTGCRVGFTRDSRTDLEDPGSVTSEVDLESSLGLLRRVDPAAAAKVEAGLPR